MHKLQLLTTTEVKYGGKLDSSVLSNDVMMTMSN